MYCQRSIRNVFLKDCINAVWRSELNAGETAVVLPDGANDLIIKASSRGANIFLCGSMTKTAQIKTEENKCYLGFRFNPGFLSLFFNFGDTRDQLIEIDSLFTESQRIEDLMDDPGRNAQLIEALVADSLLKRTDAYELKNRSRLVREYSNIQFGDIDTFSKSIGISRRQFSRNFKNYFGYDPRYFSKIKKFNRFVEGLYQKKSSLSELAIDCGFYDQADLCHSVKEISGFTPQYLMSQLYKT